MLSIIPLALTSMTLPFRITGLSGEYHGNITFAVVFAGISICNVFISAVELNDNIMSPRIVGTFPLIFRKLPGCGAINMCLKPGSSGLTPSMNRGMMFAGAAPQAWFQSRLFLYRQSHQRPCPRVSIFLAATSETTSLWGRARGDVGKLDGIVFKNGWLLFDRGFPDGEIRGTLMFIHFWRWYVS